MSTVNPFDLALSQKKLLVDIIHARRYKYEYNADGVLFSEPCALKNGQSTEPLVFTGYLVDGEWDFGTPQITTNMVTLKAGTPEERVVRNVKFKTQDTFWYNGDDMQDIMISRYRINEVLVYNDTTRCETVYEGSASDAGDANTATLLRGNWHWCRWEQISDTMCEVTYERMACSPCNPVKYAVFLEPVRKGYANPSTGEWTIDASCEILEYRKVPGVVECDKLRVFETAEALGNWIDWYESIKEGFNPNHTGRIYLAGVEEELHDLDGCVETERGYDRKYTNKKTGREEWGRGIDHDSYAVWHPYHIVEFSHGESAYDTMLKYLGFTKEQRKAELDKEYDDLLCIAEGEDIYED